MKAFVGLLIMAFAKQSTGAVLVPRDTPEVAAAKATHFAQYDFEAARNTHRYAPYLHYYPLAYNAPLLYNVPVIYGSAPIGVDGRVLDTQEVAAAKVTHFYAHVKASLKPYGALAVSPHYAYGYPYTAPIGPDGNVIDTPEVTAAKVAHFAAHAAVHH